MASCSFEEKDDELSQWKSETAGPNPRFIAGVPTKASNCLRRCIVACSSDSGDPSDFSNGLAHNIHLYNKLKLLTIWLSIQS